MKVEEFFSRLEGFLDNKEPEKVEPYLVSSLDEAKESEDYAAYISIGNEMLGYYASISDFNKAFAVAEDVLLLMEELKLENSEYFAKTLLNAAAVYRAAGNKEQTYRYFRQVFAIYEGVLPKEDCRFAVLYYDMGILLGEMEQNEEALNALEKALEIFEGKDRDENTAAHYSAALVGTGEMYCRMKAYEKALFYYEKALGEVQKYFGENQSYVLLCQNCAAVCEYMKKLEKAEDYRKKSEEARKRMETIE